MPTDSSASSRRDDGREAPDLRLLPFVAGVWAAEWAVMLGQPQAPACWAVGGVVFVALALVVGRRLAGVAPLVRPMERGGCASRRSARALLAVAFLSGSGIGCSVAALQVARLHPALIDQVVQRTSVVAATVRVTGDPVLFRPADDGGRRSPSSWSVPVGLRELRVGGRAHRVRAPVLLRGDAARNLRYGSVVDIHGRAQASWSPASSAMTIRLLGDGQIRSPPGFLARITSSIRDSFRASCAGVPADAAGLLLGLAVGDESLVPADLDRSMVRSGLAHLTAVSGSNTTLVVAIVMGAVGLAGLGWRVRVGASLLVLAGYVALVRPQPSVMRAAAMGLVALLALSAGGRRRGPPALLAASLSLLLVLPQYAVSIGFALSVSATAGLLVVGPPIAGRLAEWRVSRRVPESVRAAFAVAAAAHVATLPLAVLMGNGASLVALPANVVVTPVVPLATVLGLAAALLAPVVPAASTALAWAAAPCTGFIALVARRSADQSFGVMDVPEGPAGALVTSVVLGVLAVGFHRRWRPWRSGGLRLVACVITAIAALVGHVRAADWPPPGWVVLACDVGQGDSIILRRPESVEALLVDAGPDGDRTSDCLSDAGIERLVVLLSHYHADHIDGLAEVLDRWHVEAVLTSWVAEPAEGVAQVVGVSRAAGVPVRVLHAGDAFTAAGVSVSVLWPARKIDESPENNASVIALAEVPTQSGPVRVLLPGDVEPEAQAAVTATPLDPVDVVKVPHHGSRHQLSSFADWAGAEVALIAVGEDNEFGHPSPATIAQYQSAGSLVARTDTDGALAVLGSPGHVILRRQH
ncbi:MAG: ComEC/Rec2 family competence protein [Candidatus Nanopelagicales bacterium]